MTILPIKDRRYLAQRSIPYREIDGSQKAILLQGYELPRDRFDAANADVLILLPASYPDCAPDMFYALPWLRLVGTSRYPTAADVPLDFEGKSWQRWSRHNDAWRPGIDGIWTMLKRVDCALAVAA
jgi:hypothetical protein